MSVVAIIEDPDELAKMAKDQSSKALLQARSPPELEYNAGKDA
jgi:hypothetical protein